MLDRCHTVRMNPGNIFNVISNTCAFSYNDESKCPSWRLSVGTILCRFFTHDMTVQDNVVIFFFLLTTVELVSTAREQNWGGLK